MGKQEGYDIIIVGGGLAGLMSAVTIKDKNKYLKIALVSKVHPLRSHSVAAQGGINAVLNKDDSFKLHFYDTVKGSDFLADQDKVEAYVKDAPEIIAELEKYGALFSRKEGGEIDQRAIAGKAFIAQRDFGGESFPRTCYVADKTGHTLLHTMYEQAKKRNVDIYEDFFVTSLIISDNACVGVVAYDIKNGEFKSIQSHATILATGGYGCVYSRTTNSSLNSGDGMACVLRVGGYLMDMEFVQFHPTTLCGTNILITEGARGEGGYLINNGGERFMKHYTSKSMELAPRDIVTRAIMNEINHNRGNNKNDYVHLDLRHLGEKEINTQLPQIRYICRKSLGIDIVNDLIPVQPAQHFSMGGIPTDIMGVTSIPGLYAAGECACVSIHGANRLGGNSLLETVVFGKRAAQAAVDYIAALKEDQLVRPFPERPEMGDDEFITNLKSREQGEKWSDIKSELKNLMWEKCGIFRNEKDLIDALKKVQELQQRFSNVVIDDKGQIFNTEIIQVLELRNLLEIGETIIASALAREESRGSHFRIDFPERRDLKYLKHTLVRKTAEGIRLSYKDVTITQFKPEKRSY